MSSVNQFFASVVIGLLFALVLTSQEANTVAPVSDAGFHSVFIIDRVAGTGDAGTNAVLNSQKLEDHINQLGGEYRVYGIADAQVEALYRPLVDASTAEQLPRWVLSNGDGRAYDGKIPGDLDEAIATATSVGGPR